VRLHQADLPMSEDTQSRRRSDSAMYRAALVGVLATLLTSGATGLFSLWAQVAALEVRVEAAEQDTANLREWLREVSRRSQ